MQTLTDTNQYTDNDKFWEEWHKFRHDIFNTCLSYTNRNQHDAEDLFSEVMLKAYTQHQTNIKIIQDPFSWFLKIVFNTYITKKNYNSRLSFHDSLDEIINTDNTHAHSPYHETIAKELETLLFTSLQDQPPNQAYLARLHFEGYSYREIADKYNLTIDNIRKIIQKSRLSLKLDLSTGTSHQQKEQDKYEHIICYKSADNSRHYALLYTPTPNHRLEQKILGLRKYLSRSPYAYEKCYALAETLACTGQLTEALHILDRLLSENYYSEKVYDLKKILHHLQQNEAEAKNTCAEAKINLPMPDPKYNIHITHYQNRLKEALNFIKLQIRQNPDKLHYRQLHIHNLRQAGKFREAYEECKSLEQQKPFNLNTFPFFINSLLKYEGIKQVQDYLNHFHTKHPKSTLPSIYKLHFKIAHSNKADTNTPLRQLRRKCYWHPDYSLMRALLSSNKHKILRRRIADYPNCSLSKHYLSHFTTDRSQELPDITTEEQLHLNTIKMIYRDTQP